MGLAELSNIKFAGHRSYAEKKINNLMVICARNYYPLLKSKEKQLSSELIYQKNIEDKDAFSYAIDPRIIELLKDHLPSSDIKITDLPNEVIWETMLNISPDSILNMCRSNKLFASLCYNEDFWKEYAIKNRNEIQKYLYTLDPITANKKCTAGKTGYNGIFYYAADKEFIEQYFDDYESRFSPDGYSDFNNPDIFISYSISRRPTIENIEINIPETNNYDSMSLEEYNLLLLPNEQIFIEVSISEFELIPDTIFGTTLGSFLSQIYKHEYLSLLADELPDDEVPDDEVLNFEPNNEVPDFDPTLDSYEHGDHHLYTGYQLIQVTPLKKYRVSFE